MLRAGNRLYLPASHVDVTGYHIKMLYLRFYSEVFNIDASVQKSHFKKNITYFKLFSLIKLEEYLPDVFALEMYHLFMELCLSLSIITSQTSSSSTSAMSAFLILLAASAKFPSSFGTLTRWRPRVDD